MVSGATLTIAAGATVHVGDALDVVVDGRLVVDGTEDDSVEIAPAGGFGGGPAWGSVRLRPGSGPHSIRHALFTGGGAPRRGPMLEIGTDSVEVERSVFIDAYGTSIDVMDAAPTISYTRFERGTSMRANPSAALRIMGASRPRLEGNRFEQNEQFPIYMQPSASPVMIGNRLQYNAFNGVLLSGTVDGETLLPNLGTREAAYFIRSPGLTVAEGASLTIDPGATFRFASGMGLRVDGLLTAAGEPGHEIMFAAESPAPLPGQWSEIRIGGSSPAWDPATGTGTRLEHAIVEYGGFNADGAIVVAGSSPRIVATEVRHSLNRGITVRGDTAAPLMRGLRIVDNASETNGIGLYATLGATPDIAFSTFARNNLGVRVDRGARPRLTPHNAFLDNATYAVRNEEPDACVDASAGTWGAADGPSDASARADGCGLGSNFGAGGLVTDGVGYQPFHGQLPDPYFTAPRCGVLPDPTGALLQGYAPGGAELTLFDGFEEVGRLRVDDAPDGGGLAPFEWPLAALPPLAPGAHELRLHAASDDGSSGVGPPLYVRVAPDAFLSSSGIVLTQELEGQRYVQPYYNASGCAEVVDDGSWQAYAHPGFPTTEVRLRVPIACPGGAEPNARLLYAGAPIPMAPSPADGVHEADFELGEGGPMEVEVECGETARAFRLGVLNLALNGFVYDRDIGFDARVAGASVQLYRWDPAHRNYFPWPGEDYYGQSNPQTTGPNGWYAFFPPAGRYRAKVEAPGFLKHITGEVQIGVEPFMPNIGLEREGGARKVHLPVAFGRP